MNIMAPLGIGNFGCNDDAAPLVLAGHADHKAPSGQKAVSALKVASSHMALKGITVMIMVMKDVDVGVVSLGAAM